MTDELDFKSVHDILLAIRQRKTEAEAKHGAAGPPRRLSDGDWHIIAQREMGEVAEEIGIYYVTDNERLRDELIDLAQVCVSWVQDLEYAFQPEAPIAMPEVVDVFKADPSVSEEPTDHQGEPIEMEDGTVFRVTGIRPCPATDSLGNTEPEYLMLATRKLLALFPELHRERTIPEVGLGLKAALAELHPTLAVVTDEDGTVLYLDPRAVELRYD